MNKNGVKLLAAVAVFAMLFAGLAVAISSDETDATGTESKLAFGKITEVDYGTLYGKTSNKALNNSFSVSYNEAKSTYYLSGYIAQQDREADGFKDSAFYKLWTTNTEFNYGIAFTAKVAINDKITVGNGTEQTITKAGEEPCFLYLKGITSDSKVDVKINSSTYILDLTGLTTISVEDLKKLQIISGSTTNGTISLTQDAYLTDPITEGSKITINLNGHKLITGCPIVSMGKSTVNTDVTVNAGAGGSIESTTDMFDAYSTGTLTVNGGSYTTPGYAFIWYNGTGKDLSTTTEAHFHNVTIDAYVGVWLSNYAIKSASFENCDITAGALGIYLGTVKNATISDCNISSDGTGIEIKGGETTITGGSITSSVFNKADGTINTNGSGTGDAALNINNGYQHITLGYKAPVKVTVKGTEISSTARASVQICAGITEINSKEATAVGDIEFSIDENMPMTDLSIVQVAKTGDTDLRTISVNMANDDKEVEIVTPENIANSGDSGNVLVMSGSANMSSPVEISNGTTVMVDVSENQTSIINFKTTDDKSTVTLTSKGTTSGSITVVGMELTLIDFQGDVTISKGSVYIDGVLKSGSFEVADGAAVKLTGEVEGDFELKGPTTAGSSATVLIEDGKTVTIESGKTLKLTGNIKMNNDGNLVGGGVIDVAESAQFYTSNPVSVSFTGAGNIILEDAVEELELGKILGSVFETKPTQKVIANQNLTIANGQYLVITGGLYVPEGVTITIADGGLLMLKTPTAYAEIDGTIKSNGRGSFNGTQYAGFTVDGTVTSDVIINGSIIAAKSGETSVVTVAIYGNAILNGNVTINSKAAAEFGKLTIAEEGILEVNGSIKGALDNQGTFIMDGAVNGEMVVKQTATTAVVEIQNLKSGKLIVSDEGLYLRTLDTGYKAFVGGTGYNAAAWTKTNSISFENVKGVKVTEGIDYVTKSDGTRDPYNMMYIEGSTSISDSKATSYSPAIKVLNGTITIADEFSLSKAKMSIATNATLSVKGTMYVDDSDLPDGFTGNTVLDVTSGKLDVTGLVRVVGDELESRANIIAVMYSQKIDTKDVYFYTNLADAIASGEKELTVLGNLVILKDTEIPAGIEIDASGKTVSVGNTDVDDVTLTVKDGGFLSASEIDVFGTFIVENTDDGLDCNKVVSDTSKIGESDAMYTNIYNALSNAGEGDVIKITKKEGDVLISKDVTVPAGATLDINNKTVRILEGVTMTVDGTLYVRGTINAYEVQTNGTVVNGHFGIATEKNDGKYAVIVVNGKIESMNQMDYGIDYNTDASKYAIAGAYYTLKGKYYITPVEDAAKIITTVEDYKVDIYGAATVGDVAFEGTTEKTVIINVHGNVKADSFLVKNGKVVVDQDVILNGKFGSSVGTMTFENAKIRSGKLTIEDTIVTVKDVDTQTVYFDGDIGYGNVNNDTKKALKIAVDGTVDIKKNLGITGNNNGTSDSEFNVNGGATLTVVTEKLTVAGNKIKFQVYGDVLVKNDGQVKAPNAYVYGTFTVTEKDDGAIKKAGAVEINDLYVGGNPKATIGADNATASGKYNTNGLYLFPGAVVEGDLKNKVDAVNAIYTEFYVEDTLWMTVYQIGDTPIPVVKSTTTGPTTTYTVEIKPVLKERAFSNWQYMSSGKLVDLSNNAELSVGKYTALYADINYKVYSVEITADPGVDAIYIDGVIMKGISGNHNANVFVADVAAGNHTIEYILANGYGGNATMAVNGQNVSGYSFTAGGDFSLSTDTVEYSITLQGIEKTGYTPDAPDNNGSSDDGMGLTDYLLIVLVVLIVVMAIMVALRMMRS